MSSQDRRLDKLTEHFTPRPSLEQLADHAITALEADPNVDQVDGVPMWQIQQWCDKAIARLEGEEL